MRYFLCETYCEMHCKTYCEIWPRTRESFSLAHATKNATGFTVLCTARPGLLSRHRFPHSDLRHGPSYDGCDLPHLLHQFIELIGKQRLRTVRHGFLRLN